MEKLVPIAALGGFIGFILFEAYLLIHEGPRLTVGAVAALAAAAISCLKVLSQFYKDRLPINNTRR
jgi:hypothetical protein